MARVHQGVATASRAARVAARHLAVQLLPAITCRTVVIQEGAHDRAGLSAVAVRRLEFAGEPLPSADGVYFADAGAADRSGGAGTAVKVATFAAELVVQGPFDTEVWDPATGLVRCRFAPGFDFTAAGTTLAWEDVTLRAHLASPSTCQDRTIAVGAVADSEPAGNSVALTPDGHTVAILTRLAGPSGGRLALSVTLVMPGPITTVSIPSATDELGALLCWTADSQRLFLTTTQANGNSNPMAHLFTYRIGDATTQLLRYRGTALNSGTVLPEPS